MRVLSWINFVLGIWLICAPFALGYSGTSHVAAGEDVVLGILIAAFSLWVASAVDSLMGVSWLVLLFGLWTAVAPFLLGYSRIAAARNNDVPVGIVVLILALIRSAYARPRPVHQ